VPSDAAAPSFRGHRGDLGSSLLCDRSIRNVTFHCEERLFFAAVSKEEKLGGTNEPHSAGRSRLLSRDREVEAAASADLTVDPERDGAQQLPARVN
jgi:hypothetical protein